VTTNPLSFRVQDAFSQSVIIRLEEMNMTILELATAAEVTQSTVGFIVQGKGCHFWTAVAISRVLGISMDEIMNKLLPIDVKDDSKVGSEGRDTRPVRRRRYAIHRHGKTPQEG
jgi:plasmid maintenance system antidote protein VapI